MWAGLIVLNGRCPSPQMSGGKAADNADNYGGSTVAKAGRPQGGPRGQSEQANALAMFVRDVTKDFTVRDLAARYKIGKSTWGEYRAGTKTIELHLLHRLVHDLVRDERSRAARWEKARTLHAQAVAAQQNATPPSRSTAAERRVAEEGAAEGVTPRQAMEQATTTLQDADRLVHILLGIIAGLQMQLASPHPADPQTPAPDTQAHQDLLEAQNRLAQVRLVQSAVAGVRDEAAPYAHHPDPATTGRDSQDTLPARYAAASRDAAAILVVSRAALAEQHAAARLLSTRTTSTNPAHHPAGTIPLNPQNPLPQASRSGSRARIAAAAVALTVLVSAAATITTLALRDDHQPQARGAGTPSLTTTTLPTPSAPSKPTSPTPAPTTSPPPSPTPPPPAPPSRPPRPSALPDSYIGAWEGEFTEPGEQAPSLRRIVLRKGNVGTPVASVMTSSRTSLCMAKGTLRSTGTSLVITPRTTSGTPEHLCTPGTDITLSGQGGESLTWKSDGTTLTLHRAATPSRAVPKAFIGTWWAQDGDDPTSSVRMTVRQGALGQARAEFVWSGDAHHCEGFSVLASAAGSLRFGPETVTASEPEGFCTQTPSRVMSAPEGDTMRVAWVTSPDGSPSRSFTFRRTS